MISLGNANKGFFCFTFRRSTFWKCALRGWVVSRCRTSPLSAWKAKSLSWNYCIERMSILYWHLGHQNALGEHHKIQVYPSIYNRFANFVGYGACPLTVERGKVVFAEFGYGGKLLPTFPQLMLKSTEATRAGWIMKKNLMPWVYFDFVLKGVEWFASPGRVQA